MSKKISATKQWELDHPNDVPCPRNASPAQVWRRKRWLEITPAMHAIREKYEAAMKEKSEWEAKYGPLRPVNGCFVCGSTTNTPNDPLKNYASNCGPDYVLHEDCVERWNDTSL
jgi:hypothetical protein